jgi:hypothetical protein
MKLRKKHAYYMPNPFHPPGFYHISRVDVCLRDAVVNLPVQKASVRFPLQSYELQIDLILPSVPLIWGRLILNEDECQQSLGE